MARGCPGDTSSAVGNGSESGGFRATPLSSWDLRWGQFLGAWGGPHSQEKPLRIPEGRAKEGRQKKIPNIHVPHPTPVSWDGVWKVQSRGDTETYKSWEKKRCWHALGFLIPGMNSDSKTPNSSMSGLRTEPINPERHVSSRETNRPRISRPSPAPGVLGNPSSDPRNACLRFPLLLDPSKSPGNHAATKVPKYPLFQ